jgi:hypothetical protein
MRRRESVVSLRGMKKTREGFVVISVYFSSLHILWKCSFENLFGMDVKLSCNKLQRRRGWLELF